MYIVHEYQVEENVLTKTYLLANKKYCVYILQLSLCDAGGFIV